MTELELRDHFAGLAMQGMLSAWTGSNSSQLESVAKIAYQRADWMLKARTCTPEQLTKWETAMGDGRVPK